MEKHVDGKILPFVGTMKVHQVVGESKVTYLKMRSLSCFDCVDCNHHQIGILNYCIDDMHSSTDSLHTADTMDRNADNCKNITNGTFVLVGFTSGEGTKNPKQFR